MPEGVTKSPADSEGRVRKHLVAVEVKLSRNMISISNIYYSDLMNNGHNIPSIGKDLAGAIECVKQRGD